MAYIIGLASEREIAELVRRGWEIELPPAELIPTLDLDNTIGDVMDVSAGRSPVSKRMIMIWADTDMFQFFNTEDCEGYDPDWQSESTHTPPSDHGETKP